MKVLLINPPRDGEIIGNNPRIIEQERGYNPPLGILYVAAHVLAHSRHDVKVIDAQVEGLSYPELRGRIASAQPDIVGVAAMSFTMIDVLETVALAKAACPAAPVVLGGPHVHLFPDETIQLPGVDYLVLGEGEATFTSLLEHIDDPKRLRQLKGIVFRDRDEIVNTGPPEVLDDLDGIPFPARHLVPYRQYSSLLTVGQVVTTLMTSRGCPFRCSFCDRPHLGKRFRARCPNNVVDEIAECAQMGIREFLIYDDTFTINRQRVIEICDELRKRKLDIGFDIRAHVDTMDEQMLAELKAAGCQGIHYGIEAGSPAILRNLNKRINLDRAREVFEATRKADIPILAYFMIGNPGETAADIRTTFEVMRGLNPDYVHLTILTPFPGTPVYSEALSRGLVDTDVWREFAAEPSASFQPPHWNEHFSRAELHELLVKGYRQFYLRPTYILNRIRRLRSWDELKKKARAGLRVLGMK